MRTGTVVHRRVVSDAPRRRALLLATGAAAIAGMLAAVDPASRHISLCPTNALLGLDCPACGTLRGAHALLRGDVATALDHNVLLAVAVPIAAVALALAIAPLARRPATQLQAPRWMAVAAIGVAAVFTLVRNLPFDAFAYLASGA